MDPRLPSGNRRPVFATMSPPGHHSGEMPQSQPPPPPPSSSSSSQPPPHHQHHHQQQQQQQQQQLAAEAPPSHLGPPSHLQEASYRTKSDQHKNRSRHMKGLNVIQIASTNPVPRCRQLDSQIALEEITFWTNVCNMWLLENKKEQQPDYGEQGGGESMMDMGSLVPDASTGQEYYYYNNNNNNNNNNTNSPSHGLHGEAATTDQPTRKYHHQHHPPPIPPPTSTTTTVHSNGVEAIRAALNHNIYEDPTMPISIAATVGPPQPQTPLSAHHHHHHPHPNSPSSWMMQSPPPPPTATATATATTTTRRTADYKNNPYATMPRRGGRRDWRGQVPRPAGLQTRAEREFNGVDVYGRYKPDA